MTHTTKQEMAFLLPHHDTSEGWIGVDLDGTLSEIDDSQGFPDPLNIGAPIKPMVDRVKAWLAEGREVRIFTARVDGGLTSPEIPPEWQDVPRITKAIQDWCKEHVGQELPVTCKKDYRMAMLWDDRAVTVVKNRGTPWVKEILEAESELEGVMDYLEEDDGPWSVLSEGEVLKCVFCSDEVQSILVPIAADRLRIRVTDRKCLTTMVVNHKRREISIYFSLDREAIKALVSEEHSDVLPAGDGPGESGTSDLTKEQL